MAGPRAARLQVGSAPWITEERSSAMQIAQSEVEEFTFSARNDLDWLNEHMAEIFSENQINVAEVFKTPGKLRGKTPRTTRKANAGENRVPLSDIFSSTPKGAPNPFSRSNLGRTNTPKVKIAADPQPSPTRSDVPTSPFKPVASPVPAGSKQPVSVVDSGYHGSQSQDLMDTDDATVLAERLQPFSLQSNTQHTHVAFHASPSHVQSTSPMRPSPQPTLETVGDDASTQYFTAHVEAGTYPAKTTGHHESTTPTGSPGLPPPSSQVKASASSHTPSGEPPAEAPEAMETVFEEPSGSPSDASSPIRPIVRKSSLNFASLPAREPITHKSIGNRVSRTSHLDQNRTSYYNRHTGGKSLGRAMHDSSDEENDGMDVDEGPVLQQTKAQEPDDAVVHNKTYTQRLQDQINKLGQSQAHAALSSKSMTGQANLQPQVGGAMAATASQPTPQPRPLPSPQKTTTPGAFPEDDEEEEDWIQPLGPPDTASNLFSPRPALPKSYSADVMEGLTGKETVSGNDFALPKTRSRSPQRPPIPDGNKSTFGHHKSVSVPSFPLIPQGGEEESGLKKTISVSNPAPETVSEMDRPASPSKSPSRGFSNSPLKQVKNKLSSILKNSKGLLASSAALSAEGKSSLLSPSTTRLGRYHAPSTETLGSPLRKDAQPLYPDLSNHAADAQTVASIGGPTRTEGRRTRASIEKEKAEEKRKEKEAKEARRMADQMDKLDKAREKEREKARVFSKEQERVAALEKQVTAQKEHDKKTTTTTPGPIPKATRTSPRRAKPQQPPVEERTTNLTAEDDVEMADAPPASMPPPSAPRSVVPPSAGKGREIKRPVRPTKEPIAKAKQAPTVIRVNMGSQHSQYNPSNSTLSSGLHETLSQPQLKGKSSQPQLQTKPSLQSLKSSTSSSGRPKALEAAARRKEQEEREAQRKREAKAEIERKRAAMQEEERRHEQQRRLEAERHREEERKQAAAQAEAKKNAQRQAMLEKAKQTRAPPPPPRTQPNGPPDYNRAEGAPARPPSRMGSMAPDAGRPVNSVLSTAAKSTTKRPLPQEHSDEGATRQNQARANAPYQAKESKRMRMTDELNNDVEREKQPSLKGAPVRPSGGLKKQEMPAKSMFPAGYASASQNANRDLFKTTVTTQHTSQIKAAHPLDMAQVSKTAIPFAPNPNPAGPSHKTPARHQGVAAAKTVGKSATRSSPRFQNGESIELPEINTDDEDSDEDDGGGGGKDMVAAWADSPELRRALVAQESQDPFQVFGAPGPINMEEVFSKSKDRFHKFRARTSSANWSGADRLTDEDIRKDLVAREKMRREGGWTYEMSRDMI
ncbi:hypothetical protein GGR56DRAFT_348023 [Xylariaceae sp. FL0804]|nr:hypothetical protein GGR56DRAFT_348023 [Xylariaceae sp. FL0804]